MCYLIEPGDSTYVKGYEFLSFATSNSQKLLDITKKSIIDEIETASKRAIRKTAEATGI